MREYGKTASEVKIVLGVLQSLERKSEPTHRNLASELGIALGLANAYLKRCVNKGFLKVRTTPARRYAYFLTKRGFAEKSRLTAQYLSYSLSLFRQARAEYNELLVQASQNGWNQVALVGWSDLAEIAAICALENNIEIVGIVDSKVPQKQWLGVPVLKRFDALPVTVKALLITDIEAPATAYAGAACHLPEERIFLPDLLGVNRGATGSTSATGRSGYYQIS